MKVGLVACSNGLGHVRRTMLLAAALARRGVSVTLFAPQAAVGKLEAGLGWPSANVVDFDTCSSIEGFRSGDPATIRWIERLPSVDAFDLMVSDNLPEILERRADAILSGSFLWHRDLAGVLPQYVAQADRLLALHRPPMLTTGYVTPDYLRSLVRVQEVGFYTAFARPAQPGPDLLISCGHGSGELDAAMGRAIGRLQTSGRGGFRQVHVEPRLFPPVAPSWMLPARYDRVLYESLLAAVARPGIGTVSDCLAVGARLFFVYEPGNEEVRFNAERLAALGVAEVHETPEEAVAAAQSFTRNSVAQRTHWQAAGTIDINGADEAAQLLLAARTQ